MSRMRPPITTMYGLLNALYRDFGDRKTDARVKYYKGRICSVVEHFDDGKGHSGAFSSEYSDLSEPILFEALEKNYISGILMPGYVSQEEFKMTNEGRDFFFNLRRLQKMEKQQEIRLCEED